MAPDTPATAQLLAEARQLVSDLADALCTAVTANRDDLRPVDPDAYRLLIGSLLRRAESFTGSVRGEVVAARQGSQPTEHTNAKVPAASDPVAHQSPTSPGSSLLPCPFCGSTPPVVELRPAEDDEGGYSLVSVYCDGCSAETSHWPPALSNEAIAAWNRRATPAPAPPLDPSALRDGEVWSADDETCEWPDCNAPALCRSGNFDDRLVCGEHLRIANGPQEPAWGADDDAAMIDAATGESRR